MDFLDSWFLKENNLLTVVKCLNFYCNGLCQT